MKISLKDHFNYRKLFLFTLPSIFMMIFSSLYGVVDGFFVSNFAGKTPFAAVNLIIPFWLILATVGFMFAENYEELQKYFPDEKLRPSYTNNKLYPYNKFSFLSRIYGTVHILRKRIPVCLPTGSQNG